MAVKKCFQISFKQVQLNTCLTEFLEADWLEGMQFICNCTAENSAKSCNNS